MRKLVLITVLVNRYLGAITGAARVGWPGYEYQEAIHGWLKLYSEPKDYQDARVTCHMEDAILAAMWNVNFTAAISGVITPLVYISSEEELIPAIYSGAHEKFLVNQYVNGEPTFTLIPNGLEGLKPCIAIYWNGTTGEIDCEQRLPFVCFAPAPGCGREDLGYKFDKRTGQCYKFNSLKTNWTEAYNACRKEGADLAVVNSDTEAQVLKELFPSTGSNYASVGFYFWKPSSSWWTVHGQTIQQAGFATWHSVEPTSGALHGFFYKDGTLYSQHASKNASFICEKHPALPTVVGS